MRRRIGTFILLLVCVAAALALWPGPPQRVVMPDGTTIVLTGVQVGLTNVFVNGTLLSRTLGRLVPRKGFSFAGFKVAPPETTTFRSFNGVKKLAVELRLQPGAAFAAPLQASPSPQGLAPWRVSKAMQVLFPRPAPPGLGIPADFAPRYRVLISGQDDFTFVQDFSGFFWQNGSFVGYIATENFPRTARQLRLGLQVERRIANSNDWTELAAFEIKNPRPVVVPPAQPALSPRCQIEPGAEMEIGDVVVRQMSNKLSPGEFAAELPMRVISNGQIDRRWEIANGYIQDASGNYVSFPAQNCDFSNEWTVYHLTRPLDPACCWKFTLNGFFHYTNFPAGNLYSFDLVWPLLDTFRTNLGDFEVAMEEAFQMGSSGVVVILTGAPSGMRIAFVDAVDDAGHHVGTTFATREQYRWTELFKPIRPHSRLHLTIAIQPDFPVEFTLMPRLEKSETSPPSNSNGP